MYVRVVIEPTRVGVQHGDGAGRALQLPVGVGELVHGGPGAAHELVEHDVGAGVCQRAQFGRQGESQQEMIGRDQALHLTLQPLLAFVVLAVRAQTMAARVRHQRALFAVRAAKLHHRAGRAATAADSVECAALIGREAVPEAGVQVGVEAGFRADGPRPDALFRAPLMAGVRPQ